MIPDLTAMAGLDHCVPRVGGGDPVGMLGAGPAGACSPRRRG